LAGSKVGVMSTDDTSETNDVFVYTGEGEVQAPQNVVRVRIDPSVTTIPTNAFFQRKKLAEVELCDGLSWKLGVIPSDGATFRLQISTYQTHSGGLRIFPSCPLSKLLFVSTMALKALEDTHSLAASSPTLESHRSSL
jgi:hypothetical protein